MEIKKISYGKMADLNLKVIITLARCIQTISSKESPLIRSYGLTMPQFGVLELLYHKGPLRINEIIRKTLSTGGNMTVVIDNLEKEELLKRQPDPIDRRVVLVKISEKGKRLISDLFPKHVANLNEINKVLSAKEKQQLISLLKKLGKK